MGIGLLAGIVAAAVAAVVVVALLPRPAPLAGRVRTALTDAAAAPGQAGSWWVRWQRQLVRVDDRLGADLHVTGTTIEQLVARRLVWTAVGAAVPLVAWPVGLAQLGVPLLVAPVAALAGAAAGWMLALHEFRDQAATRRREMHLALAAYLQLASTMIRAGTGEEQALRDAAAAGSGWAFETLQRATARAMHAGTGLAQTFDALGADLGVLELRALGGELRIATRQGSSPAPSLIARASALRDEDLAVELAAANRAEQRMAAPLVGLGLCVVVFIIFPALATFIT